MFEKSFCTYDPEAHGLRTGSNNGNYEEHANFRYKDNKFYVKYTSSGDGDMFSYPDWEEVTPEEFLAAYEKAVIEEYEESNLAKEEA